MTSVCGNDIPGLIMTEVGPRFMTLLLHCCHVWKLSVETLSPNFVAFCTREYWENASLSGVVVPSLSCMWFACTLLLARCLRFLCSCVVASVCTHLPICTFVTHLHTEVFQAVWRGTLLYVGRLPCGFPHVYLRYLSHTGKLSGTLLHTSFKWH